MNEESQNSWIEPELEARIVAHVLGETSDFEREELNRQIKQRPELAAFKLQMQRVHGLLQHVGTGEFEVPDENWKLPTDRRNAVLAAVRGEATVLPAIQDVDQGIQNRLVFKRRLQRYLTSILAVVCIAIAIASYPFFVQERAATEYSYEMAKSDAPPYGMSLRGGTSLSLAIEPESAVSYVDPQRSLQSISEDLGYTWNSESALSAIKDTLNRQEYESKVSGSADDVRQMAVIERATKDSEPDSSGKAVEAPELIAKNDIAWMFDGSRFRDRDGEFDAMLPRIVITEDVELSVSGMTQGIGSLNGTLESEYATRSLEELNAPIRGWQDLSPYQAGREQQLTTELSRERAGASPDFSKDPVASPGGGNQTDGEHFGNESKATESLDLFGATDARGTVDNSLESRVEGGGGLGDTAVGSRGVFSGGLPADKWNKKSPEDAKGIATEFPGTEVFDSSLGTNALPGLSGKPMAPSASAEDYANSDRAPVPIADMVEGRPEVTFSENGRNDIPESQRSLFLKQQRQQRESKRESGELANEHFDGRSRYLAPVMDDESELMKKRVLETVAPSAGLSEKSAAEEAFSTFSLHVSDVSFKLALAALAHGEWPEAAKIRIEEFVNAFDYGDPLPSKGERVACRVEQSIHPFIQQRNLLRVSMRTAAEGRSSNTPLRLTLLLDNSGSMERTDRQQTVRRAFALLSQQLTSIDQVTLISFARQPRLLADKVSGAESGQLVRLIDELPSEGGTNIETALQLAFEKAKEQQAPDAQNRIILLTDGAVNLGNADPESLSQMVSTMRGAGIAFDAAGISAEGLNDEVLEALTRKGDGRYYLLDSLEAADDGFARQIAGALRPSARNVKVQIEFNPKRVGRYKLLGFEKHILKQEDFRNDAVDAAEMAAAEAGVALYQFEAKPDGEGDVGSVSVRFHDLSTGQMIENRWPIPYEANAPRPDQASSSLRICASAALLAAKLRGEPLGETVDLQTLSHLISGLPEQDRNNMRVQQLKRMIEQARQLSQK